MTVGRRRGGSQTPSPPASARTPASSHPSFPSFSAPCQLSSSYQFHENCCVYSGQVMDKTIDGRVSIRPFFSFLFSTRNYQSFRGCNKLRFWILMCMCIVTPIPDSESRHGLNIQQKKKVQLARISPPVEAFRSSAALIIGSSYQTVGSLRIFHAYTFCGCPHRPSLPPSFPPPIKTNCQAVQGRRGLWPVSLGSCLRGRGG